MVDEVTRCMEHIADWLFEHGDESTQLKFGIWSYKDFPHTYYALIESGDRLICGESSYGSDTIEDALKAVVDELRETDMPESNQHASKPIRRGT